MFCGWGAVLILPLGGSAWLQEVPCPSVRRLDSDHQHYLLGASPITGLWDFLEISPKPYSRKLQISIHSSLLSLPTLEATAHAGKGVYKGEHSSNTRGFANVYNHTENQTTEPSRQ